MTNPHQIAWNWYSRESVQRALIEVAKNREVVSVYKDSSFGKRPDVILYNADILQAVAEGALAFHGSVERWQNPMKLDVSLTKQELDELRIGWDIILDPDVEDFEISKITAKVIIEALKDHGISNFSIKFSGGKGFHIGIPFEALPEKVNFQLTKTLYPELFQKIIEYLKWYIKDQLKEEILSLDTPNNISQRIGKPLNEIINSEGLDPFKVISFDVFSIRHLIRLPYSLHEKTLLVSVPIKYENLEKFEKEYAKPEKVKIDEKFLVPKYDKKDAEGLIIEALDWAAKYKIEPEIKVWEEVKTKKMVKIKPIPEDFFPPCIKRILEGMIDGRKRSLFILINFLRNVGWSNEMIEKKVFEWNERNSPPLRTNYIRSQLRWHFRQERNLLPPNCQHENFYLSLGLYQLCEAAGLHRQGIKNPVNWSIRQLTQKKKRK
ncbi:MAG: hypothetical protein QXQ18_02950 [Candidatus Aenigmatarchaeota archaeon]